MKSHRILTALLLTGSISAFAIAQNQNTASPFTPPDTATRQSAVGNLKYLPEEHRKSFTSSASFDAKNNPDASD